MAVYLANSPTLYVSRFQDSRGAAAARSSSIAIAARARFPAFGGLQRRFLHNPCDNRYRAWAQALPDGSTRAQSLKSRDSSPSRFQVADLEDILAERDACGVGFIASTKQESSHKVIEDALTALGCMEHRGGCGADSDSGDGAGLMTRIPWDMLNSWFQEQGLPLPDQSNSGVGMVFLPRDEASAIAAKQAICKVFNREGLEILGWRKVPVDVSVVGYYAKMALPTIEQVFVKVSGESTVEDVERELYISRKLVEREIEGEAWGDECYFCSLSAQTIVYKGMLRSEVLGQFYLDLREKSFTSTFAIYHRRYSTNTNPKWPLAQPMRFLGHNGEINTLQGNLNWMRSREASLKCAVWRGREEELRPFGNPRASDSANLDMAAELLMRSGRTPEATLMMLVPEAYKNHPTLSIKYPEVIDFYEYYTGQMEAWDGPALLLFSDGRTVGACLDRNGLRPARYWETKDGMLYVASEVGVLPIPDSDIISKGRLGPGMMIAIDLNSGKVSENTEVKKRVALSHPYRQWLDEKSRSLPVCKFSAEPFMDTDKLLQRQQAFGYSSEDVQMVIESMASQGKEPTFCMGDDIPLAVLSQRGHMLYDYFKQRFAQVTNPAIDPLREGLVMSLDVNIGKRENILEPKAENAAQLKLLSPVLNEGELETLKTDPVLKASTIPTFFDISNGLEGSLSSALDKLCEVADEAVRGGSQLLILSDRANDLVATKPAIPMLLAVGAVHHHLIQNGLRTSASLIADTAQCFSTHHFACLVGYGASAICPYLALETCRQWRLSNRTVGLMKNGKIPTVTIEQAQQNFRKAVRAGLLKILSKMGISLLSSYCGAQIFEIYGLGKEVVDTAFRGSVSRIGGVTLDELARESVSFWAKGLSDEGAKKLENYGFIQFRNGAEYHGNNPEMSKLLHKAVREKNESAYAVYQNHLSDRPVNVLRDLLTLKSDREPIPLSRIEPATSIVERFCTGGMSLGAISRETHEVIAIAMNRLGGKSNSGEGGEDPVRWRHLTDVVDGYSPTLPHLRGLQNGDTATSVIKQVASGRFGVTPTFLANADQLEIKIAQGAKPGEGGQLPGKKVSTYIAVLRNSKPGVPLISPPPHHDIYSIEDLAQLIFDLHQVNPRAKVSVKLVAEAGIGTVASGVAKANADIIQISGHDGGTGASPISSIKHAGGPWELGLTETQQALLLNGLRERVVLRVDGGFKSGMDVLMAAAMGADEYGFGSVAMIATGCIMARICHTNNCPVGVASQREELRARFPGVPNDLCNFFLYVAEEVRGLLAHLGYEKLDDVIGRTELLQPRHVPLVKTRLLDLSYLLSNAGLPKLSSTQIRRQNVHTNGPVLDDVVLADPEISEAIADEKTISKTFKIYNVDRAVCGRIAGSIAKAYGDTGFAGQLNITFIGSAGQSFGCFLTPGMNIRLIGESNDYVGKGMAGGELVITPPEKTGFVPEDSTIIGNTCLYGATGGQFYSRGKAGERFAVRNSRAEAVVEGAGDHCCEYMTGGCVVSLGKVGRNVGAGMTGGLAYFLDEDDTLTPKVNKEIVRMQRVTAPAGQVQLRRLIQAHVDKTGSSRAIHILQNWDAFLPKFWQLVPPSEEDTPEANEAFSDETIAEQLVPQSA
ncbi:ferredoxin-dependent glutamate synthase, chloroplastic [Selaginella moellendorffii]|uniref:ferredoxin-dependent glutamate synthase, chloroplastic n=1 Tax=Selaginella moellendorffii TaxID=88036 RepID=UPI000D1C84E4|nr:ferredoxin-dependent glutamate synthase, chloroplastic [Selaginella moellendorffii]|eukprot:XP_024543692.1 ferredoxin-dependent glutamate synthase, chloroplastic [Selaginella moellendorffii]